MDARYGLQSACQSKICSQTRHKKTTSSLINDSSNIMILPSAAPISIKSKEEKTKVKDTQKPSSEEWALGHMITNQNEEGPHFTIPLPPQRGNICLNRVTTK